jgi:hypothetical protein
MKLWRAPYIRPDIYIPAAGLLLAFMHLLVPESFYYSCDSAAHVDYIQLIARHFRFPYPDDCYECHQPALYYLVNAVAVAAGGLVGLDSVLVIKIMALILFIAFIFVSRRLLRAQIASRMACATALALVVFWPSGLMKAASASNDMPEALMQVACLYYLTHWWRTLHPMMLAKSLVMLGLAVSVKQSGIILIPIVATTIALRWLIGAFPIQSRLCNRKIFLSLITLSVLVFVTFGRTYYFYRIVENHPSQPLMNPKIEFVDYHMYMPNDALHYYLTFNLPGYFHKPFFIPRDPDSDRYYVWNSLFKSALYSEFSLKSLDIAIFLDSVELLMALYMIATGFAALRFREFDVALLPFFCFMGWQLCMIITARARYPTANNEDFRFIYASVPVMAVLYGRAIMWYEKHRFIAGIWLGRGCAASFIIASILLFLVQDAYINF